MYCIVVDNMHAIGPFSCEKDAIDYWHKYRPGKISYVARLKKP